MSKIKVLVASVALAAGVTANAAYHSTPAPVVPCKQHQLLPKLDRNQNMFMAQCDWDKRIKISGMLRASYGRASDVIGLDNGATNTDFHHMLTFNDELFNTANQNVESGSDMWLDRAVINFDAVLNDWAEAHVSAMYWNEDSTFGVADAQMYNRYHGSWLGNGNTLPINEANIVLGNFAQTPVYFRIGRQYSDFGWYQANNGVATLTQLFSQGLHDAVTVGFVDVSGFSGSLSAFRSVERGSNENVNGGNNPAGVDRPSDSINNFVASLAYDWDNGTLSVNAKLDYMHDVFGVDFFDGYLGNGIIGAFPAGDFTQGWGTNKAIRPDNNNSMWALTLKGHYGDFDAMGQYVGLSSSMSEDLWSMGGSAASNATDTDIHGARPRSWMAELGYSFPLMGRDSRLSVNYQKTKEAYAGMTNTGARITNYYIPERRVQVNFDHNLAKGVDLGVSYISDHDYSTSHFQSFHSRDANDVFGTNFRNTAGTGNKNSMLLLSLTGRFS